MLWVIYFLDGKWYTQCKSKVRVESERLAKTRLKCLVPADNILFPPFRRVFLRKKRNGCYNRSFFNYFFILSRRC